MSFPSASGIPYLSLLLYYLLPLFVCDVAVTSQKARRHHDVIWLDAPYTEAIEQILRQDLGGEQYGACASQGRPRIRVHMAAYLGYVPRRKSIEVGYLLRQDLSQFHMVLLA